MINSPFLNEQAAVFARDIRKEAGDNLRAQVTLALRRTTQRTPTEVEIARGVTLVERMQTEHQISAEAALTNFCLLTLNLNEFMYLE